MKRFTHETQLKSVFACDECQKKSHCQKKKVKIQKYLWKIHESDDISLTFCTLSEKQKSSI